MSKQAIIPAGTATVGPYSPGIEAGEFVFLSGQIALDAATGKLVAGGIEAQTEQCFANIANLLAAAGLTLDHVVKATVYLADMQDFAAVNAVYASKFTAPYPARSAVGVAALPLGARVEIEVIARRY